MKNSLPRLLSVLLVSVVFTQNKEANKTNDEPLINGPRSHLQVVDGIAAVVGNKVILTSDINRSLSMAVFQQQLNPQQDAAVEKILYGSFTLELWLLDEAAKPDNVVNASLFYKADETRFSANSMWFYRARQDGHYYFWIRGATERPVGVSIRNPAGDKAAGDG